ncbi:MAG: MFS transporter [Gammaproteobacteria bacterium]|nr:MFS transporter [Gammaproteobacteria bacterium]
MLLRGFSAGFLGHAAPDPAGRINPRIRRVCLAGFIRAAGACAVRAAAGVWAIVRMLAGPAVVGVFIVAESWLNGEASNANRGRLLSLYIIVCQVSLAGGQYLLGVADPMGFELFVLVSVLCSLAAVPIALSSRSAPRFEESATIGIRILFRRIPLTLVGVLLISLSYGSFYAMGPVYAIHIGLDRSQIATFMAVAIMGSVIMQWPLGLLSDRSDRRRLIALLCAAVAVVAALLALVPAQAPKLMFVLMFFYGGLSFPLYSLFLALAGDYLRPEEMVAACSKILLVNGLGSALGPLLVAWLMESVATVAYMLFLALVHAGVGLIVLRNLYKVREVVVDQPVHYAPATPQSSIVATEMAGASRGRDLRYARARRQE